MRIYIVEDDTSVIGILEDIVEGNELGVVCGDSGGEPANLGQILALDPDLVLVDLLMPQKDGIQVVRELKEQGCRAKFIMISPGKQQGDGGQGLSGRGGLFHQQAHQPH